MYLYLFCIPNAALAPSVPQLPEDTADDAPGHFVLGKGNNSRVTPYSNHEPSIAVRATKAQQLLYSPRKVLTDVS
jgi:hypothetical protein